MLIIDVRDIRDERKDSMDENENIAWVLSFMSEYSDMKTNAKNWWKIKELGGKMKKERARNVYEVINIQSKRKFQESKSKGM